MLKRKAVKFYVKQVVGPMGILSKEKSDQQPTSIRIMQYTAVDMGFTLENLIHRGYFLK